MEYGVRKGWWELLSSVHTYVPDGDERHLNLRTFDKEQKTPAHERQNGLCAICGNWFRFAEMEGDHIIPWKDGGLTDEDKLRMLCRPSNRRKGPR